MTNNIYTGQAVLKRGIVDAFRWEDVLRTLDDHAIVSIANAAGDIIYVNSKFCDVSGYSEAELLGKNHRVIKSGIHTTDFYHEMWSRIRSGKRWHGEICNTRKDGSHYWVESTISPVMDEQGQVVQYISIRTDITAIKEAEEALEAQNRSNSCLAKIAQKMLASRIENARENAEFALKSCVSLMNLEAIGLWFPALESREEDACHFIAYPALPEQSEQILQSLCKNRRNDTPSINVQSELRAISDADKTAHDIISNGVLVPVFVSEDYSGSMFVAVKDASRADIWWARHQQFMMFFVDLIGSMIRRAHLTTQLVESKERLRRGQLYANIGTWEWNIRSGALYWSEKIAPLFGYGEGEVETSYDNFINAVHPDDRVKVQRAVDEAIVSNVPYDIEHRVVWPDGSVHWVSERGAVNRDEKGDALKMLGVVQDINQRKLAQLELEERELQLRQSRDLAKLASWKGNPVTREVTFSDNAAEIYGVDLASEVLSLETCEQRIFPLDKPLLIAAYKQTEETGEFDTVHRILRPDGAIRHLHIVGKSVANYKGDGMQMIGVIQDITQRIEIEQQLQETEQLFTFAVEGAGDGVWDWYLPDDSVEISASCRKMLGYENEAVRTKAGKYLDMLDAEDARSFTGVVQQCIYENLESFKVQLRSKTADGGLKWILCRGSVVERDDRQRAIRIIGVNSDISEIKSKEMELTKARNEADTANRAKSEFLSHMSHELRTPLNAILGFGQLLDLDSSLSESNAAYASEMLKAGYHLLDLINDILDLAKVESGKIDINIEKIDLGSLLEEVAVLMEPLKTEKNIVLVIPRLDSVVVQADRVRLKQVLINLLSNAFKYNYQEGKVTVIVELEKTGYVHVIIEDTGPGIDERQMKDLFKPFSRLGAEKTGIQGTGIGLTLTKKIIESMGGDIDVSSVVGVGSRFGINLPLVSKGNVGKSLPVNANDNPDPDISGNKTLLYIDDNQSNLTLVRNIVENIPGVRFLEAGHAELGLELATNNRPDLIFVDINMPDMDGYAVLKALRSMSCFKTVPIMAVTANAMVTDIEKGREAGFTEYICKPVDVRKLHDLVLKTLWSEDLPEKPYH